MIQKPVCQGCGKHPDELDEYIDAAMHYGRSLVGEGEERLVGPCTPDDYVRREEGTYNPANGHFLCTSCYCDAGMPSSPTGWVCP